VRTDLPRSSVDAPAFEPRGNPESTTVPPCLRRVMPAFVPGWDAILQVSSSSFCARVGACLVSCFFGPSCRAPPLRSATVAEPPACARPCTGVGCGDGALGEPVVPSCVESFWFGNLMEIS
jgi:hypothetical protein